MTKTRLNIVWVIFLFGTLNSIAQEIEYRLIINDSTKQAPKNISKKFNSIKELEAFKKEEINSLWELGYIHLKVDSLISNKNSIQQYISLNQRIDSIFIDVPEKYATYIEGTRKKIKIKFEEWEKFQEVLINNLRANGYDFAKVKYSPVSVHGNYLFAKLAVEVNELKKYNRVYIKGYKQFPKSFKKHHIRISKGEIYTEKKLKQRTKTIQNLDFVNEIKNPEVQFSKDSVNVFLYLEKRKINSFDGFIGFSNEDEGSGLDLNGYLDVVLKNNLNLGETLIIQYKNDGQEQQIFQSRLELPFIFNSRFTPEAGIELFRQDSTFSRSTQELKLGYHINHQWSIATDLEAVNSSNLLANEEEPTSTSTIGDYKSNFYGVSTRFLNRKKNIGQIVHQDLIKLRILQGRRKSLNKNLQQLRLEFYGETLQKILKNTYLNLASVVQIIDSDQYLNNELYRLGGLRSMRGFEENSLIASSFYSLQTEIRYFLSSDLYVNSVLDYGYYQNELVNLKENLVSFGFGIGLNTKGGLLRLIFANGRSSQQKFNFQNTQVHLSLNTFF